MSGASNLSKSFLVQTYEQARAAYWLREASKLGSNVVVDGRPHIANAGTLSFGDEAYLSSRPVQSHLVASRGATLTIGKRVAISYGAAISAQREVTIGDDSRIGPFVVIMDSDFHVVGDRNAHGAPSPVRIGTGVIVESRVTILRGACLGDGARVRSGSVVSGNVPAHSVVAGVPARPLVEEAPDEQRLDLPQLVQRVLGLSALPGPSDGPAQISEWDSLGTLKLLLALERSYGVAIREDQLKSAQSVAGLSKVVEAALAAK